MLGEREELRRRRSAPILLILPTRHSARRYRSGRRGTPHRSRPNSRAGPAEKYTVRFSQNSWAALEHSAPLKAAVWKARRDLSGWGTGHHARSLGEEFAVQLLRPAPCEKGTDTPHPAASPEPPTPTLGTEAGSVPSHPTAASRTARCNQPVPTPFGMRLRVGESPGLPRHKGSH